jgi:hypothetical protein
MSVAWGNPEEHTKAFREALAEYRREHPEDQREFYELDREPRTLILARQVQIYSEIRGRA